MSALINIVVAGFFILLSQNSIADEEKNRIYIGSLIHGNDPFIQNVAQKLSKISNVDLFVLDVLAETLLRDYRTVNAENIESILWRCNALGASANARYRAVLLELKNESENKKVSKYAKKALKKLGVDDVKQYSGGDIVLSNIKLKYKKVENPYENMRSIAKADYIGGLIHGNSKEVQYSIKLLYSNEVTDIEVLDVLSEVLLRDLKSSDDYVIDGISWGCKVLGASENSRYEAVLSEIKNSAENKKVIKYAKRSVKQLSSVKADLYLIGTIAIAELRNIYGADKKIVRPGDRYRKAVSKPDLPIDEYATLVVFRPSFSPPLAYKPMITINGRKAFYLSRGCKFDVKLLPGEYKIGVNWGKWHGVQDVKSSLVVLAGGDTRYFKNATYLMPLIVGNLNITNVSDGADLSGIKSCDRWQADWLVRNSMVPRVFQKHFNEDNLVEDIKNQNYGVRREVISFITRNGAYTDRVLKALKVEILKFYLEPFSSNDDLKSISSLSRALVQSESSSYKKFLYEVVSNPKDIRLGRYTKKYISKYTDWEK